MENHKIAWVGMDTDTKSNPGRSGTSPIPIAGSWWTKAASYKPTMLRSPVDAEAQIIVAGDITQEANDKQQLAPMLEQVEQSTGGRPKVSSVDTGY